MNNFRQRHQVVTDALNEAKKKAISYDFPKKTIMFKKIDSAGRVGVGFKPFGEGLFRLVPRKEVEAAGINIDSLPEYTEFNNRHRELMRPANDYFRQTCNLSRQEFLRAKAEMLRPIYQARRRVYDEYMGSVEWSQKRQSVFQHQGSDCIDCGKFATDIHHLHYETLGDECPVNDLVPLCRSCHEKRHEIEAVEL